MAGRFAVGKERSSRMAISLAETGAAGAEKENFAALLEESLEATRGFEGTVVKGRVIAVENDMALIDVGLKAEGRVPLKEFDSFVCAPVCAPNLSRGKRPLVKPLPRFTSPIAHLGRTERGTADTETVPSTSIDCRFGRISRTV